MSGASSSSWAPRANTRVDAGGLSERVLRDRALRIEDVERPPHAGIQTDLLDAHREMPRGDQPHAAEEEARPLHQRPMKRQPRSWHFHRENKCIAPNIDLHKLFVIQIIG